ncbi:MAG: STAS domain-containing protein [Psychrobium sp.]|nr:STAS domain-containing protein [Psychrobium sp.]
MEAINIALPPTLDISSVSEFHQTILTSLNNNTTSTSVIIDTGANERVDTAGIQLLLVLINELSNRDLAFSWQNMSNDLHTNANRLDLKQALKLT